MKLKAEIKQENINKNELSLQIIKHIILGLNGIAGEAVQKLLLWILMP